MTQNGNGYRTQPMYTFSEAAHLADVSAGTVRNWLLGYTRPEMLNAPTGRVIRQREVDPLFNTMPHDTIMVSFLQPAEVVVSARFRKAEHVQFATVKQAYQNARREYGLDYPFAHLDLEALGGHIVERLRESHARALDDTAQWTLPNLVGELVQQLDYDHQLASRWYPAGKAVPIVVDPRISAGVPTIKGRGITVGMLQWRWKQEHQTIDFIAEDFDLSREHVEQVLQYAENVAA